MSGRHPSPSYEEDAKAGDNYVYDDGDEPDYNDQNYTTEDLNPRLADEERQETNEDLARMQQREADAEVEADVREHQGDIDDDGGEGWLEEGRDEEANKREMVEREEGYGREELDDTYDVGEEDDHE